MGHAGVAAGRGGSSLYSFKQALALLSYILFLSCCLMRASNRYGKMLRVPAESEVLAGMESCTFHRGEGIAFFQSKKPNEWWNRSDFIGGTMLLSQALLNR
ncbi:hypothetical protein ERJ70_06750 [Sediminibacillus dalangtanensis]|uniref:Uncharacterized protein n=1 Tax=Sediminibacillus dalangtanensis TaxID=2729421 RepID=A0ABX7VT88_9BACI|nr:hypothetical protein [Sediminibacillus dalangtanensis]QTM99025.1 hypothetical protein ERJ70_06750 [Sediminibacillus dalangtanensis]